jgi:hypothetical protein
MVQREVVDTFVAVQMHLEDMATTVFPEQVEDER